MEVEIINDHIQKFNGKRYNAGLKGQPYYRRQATVDGKLTTVSLHREVWRYHYGDIPKGWHIHHRDHDWKNNKIDNLVLTPYRLHMQYHWQDPQKKADQAKRLNKYGRPKAIAWHKSEVAKPFHRRIAKQAWENKELHLADCRHCHTTYSTPFPSRAKYCSLNCKMKARTRRLKGLPEDMPTKEVRQYIDRS